MADTFLNFLDRIDGGGKGKSGDEFEGGGLLSALGNALFKPAGYADRQIADTRPQSRPQRVPPSAPPTVPQSVPPSVPTSVPTVEPYFPEMPVGGAMPMGNAPYFPEMPVGGAMPPMAVNPAANNQTLNPYPTEQDLGRLDQLHGEYSPAYRHHMLDSQLNRNAYNMAPNSVYSESYPTEMGGAGVPLQSVSPTQPQAGGFDPRSMGPSSGISPSMLRMDLSELGQGNRMNSSLINRMFDERDLYDLEYMTMLENEAARRAAGGY